jgi:aspartyl-tRNA(Asn)/glutamyl-tRNA(Gln) amidotransferase subunit C
MKIDILHIAKLANLTIDNNEIKLFENQLLSILSYIDKLKEVKTENVKETSQVTNLENILRDDQTKPSLSQKEALSGSKNTHNGFFKIKAIFE